MFYCYILKSLKDGDKYIGSTNDLKRRFKEHNSGLVDSTKSRTPLKLVYYEAYASELDARTRERNLKTRTRVRRQLLLRIEKSLASD